MSRLGDVLVDLGPIQQDYVVTPGLSSDLYWVRADELNALRDELIELRRLAGEQGIGKAACSCCGRPVAPLDTDGQCGHCGANRNAGTHTGDAPCRPRATT